MVTTVQTDLDAVGDLEGVVDRDVVGLTGAEVLVAFFVSFGVGQYPGTDAEAAETD